MWLILAGIAFVLVFLLARVGVRRGPAKLRTGPAKPSPESPDERIRQLVMSGHAAKAAKLYVETHHVDAGTAMQAIDEIERECRKAAAPKYTQSRHTPAKPAVSKERHAEFVDLAQRGEKAGAISLYRELYGGSLREAIQAVDSIAGSANLSAAAPAEPQNHTDPQSAPMPGSREHREVSLLVERGRDKIQAVRVCREVRGGRLEEAKYKVESIGGDSTEAKTPDHHPRHEDILKKIQRGQRIEAVKLYRELYGCDLLQAKRAVNLIAEGNDPLEFQPMATIPAEAIQASGAVASDGELLGYVRRGEKLRAIERYRELTGVGLAEAQSAIEEIERRVGKFR